MLKNTHRPFQVAGQGVLPAKRMYYWLLYHLNMLRHMTGKLNRMQEYAEFYLTKHKSSTLRRTAERLLFAIVSIAERRECWMTAVFRGRLGTTVTRKPDAKLTQRRKTQGLYMLNLDNNRIYIFVTNQPSVHTKPMIPLIHPRPIHDKKICGLKNIPI